MAKRAKTIDLLRVVALLQEHITPALCRTVFGAVRTTERQRVWTLEALIRFWTAVVLRAPKELTQALVDSLEGRDPPYPRIEARALSSAVTGGRPPLGRTEGRVQYARRGHPCHLRTVAGVTITVG